MQQNVSIRKMVNKITMLMLLLLTSLKIITSSPELNPQEIAHNQINAFMTDRRNELNNITNVATGLKKSRFCNPDKKNTPEDTATKVMTNRLNNSIHFNDIDQLKELLLQTDDSYWSLNNLSDAYKSICNISTSSEENSKSFINHEEVCMKLAELDQEHKHNCDQLNGRCNDIIAKIVVVKKFYDQVVDETNAVVKQYNIQTHALLVRHICQSDKDLGVEINDFLGSCAGMLLEQLKEENKLLTNENKQLSNHAFAIEERCNARIKKAEDMAIAAAKEKQAAIADLAATKAKMEEMDRNNESARELSTSSPIERILTHYLHGGCTIM